MKYYVTGWSNRYCQWQAEMVDAKNKPSAVEIFKLTNPTLKGVKVYRLKGVKQ